MIDTHAHIYLDKFKKDLAEVMDRTIEKNVKKILMPNIDSTTIDSMLEMEELYQEVCYSMMGLHPCSVSKKFEKDLYIVEQWVKEKKFIAIGEIGIDLYWDNSLLEYQKEAFKVQVELALENDLPIAVHVRDSMSETIEILKGYSGKKLKGVIHCFSGTEEDAKVITEELGLSLGIGGVLTFKNSYLDEAITNIDLDHFLLETDSPYLTPHPNRGKRNEPSFLSLIAEKLASVKKCSLEEIEEKTTNNAEKLFLKKG